MSLIPDPVQWDLILGLGTPSAIPRAAKKKKTLDLGMKYSWENVAKKASTTYPLAKYRNVKVCSWHKKQTDLTDNGYDIKQGTSKVSVTLS